MTTLLMTLVYIIGSIILYGLIGPYLISSYSDIGVILGLVLVILHMLITLYLAKITFTVEEDE